MRRVLVLVSLLVFTQSNVWAQENPALSDSFLIAVGGFYPQSSTNVRLDPANGGLGSVIDFERTLGLQEDKFVFEAGARFRWANRWRVEAEYFSLNREGDRTIDRQIEWGNQVYPVNAQLITNLDFTDTRISVGYSFFKTDDKEIGISLGAHVADYDARINAGNLSSQGGKVTAPLPVLSLYGQFALTPKWALDLRLDRFSMSYDQYDGDITSIGMDVQYALFRHTVLSLGYRNFFMKLQATSSDWHGEINQTYQGPLVLLKVQF